MTIHMKGVSDTHKIVVGLSVVVIAIMVGCSESANSGSSDEILGTYHMVGYIDARGKRPLYQNPDTGCVIMKYDGIVSHLPEQQYNVETGKCEGYYQNKLK